MVRPAGVLLVQYPAQYPVEQASSPLFTVNKPHADKVRESLPLKHRGETT